MTVDEQIRAASGQRPCTLLGVGVVSRTTVDAAVELANEHAAQLMLIPSRRQVDRDELGSGYVCGWNAERFADYVKARDTGGHILLCRDHGGPWQNSVEIARRLSPEQALESAKTSYREDIEAGFQVIHIDPSVTPDGEPTEEEALERLFELYTFCKETAASLGRDIAIEVGTEEQDSMSRSSVAFFNQLERIIAFCEEHGFAKPTFVVAQTGTKVMEARNVGLLDSPYRIDGAVPTEILIPRLIDGLNRVGILLKQHNTDYLSDEVLRWHPFLGIHAANVAPEFGVEESRALVFILEAKRLNALRDRFIELSHQSDKWVKWMLPDTKATDRDRAIISGHYVFSSAAFEELRKEIVHELEAVGVDLDAFLLDRVKASIFRYMKAFRLVEVQ